MSSDQAHHCPTSASRKTTDTLDGLIKHREEYDRVKNARHELEDSGFDISSVKFVGSELVSKLRELTSCPRSRRCKLDNA